MQIRSKKGKGTRKNTYRTYKKNYWEDHPQSVNEHRIENWLNKNRIFHLREARFNDNINPETGQVLSIDFYLPKLNCAIEFDSEIHWKFIKHLHLTKERFEAGKRRDKVKNEYCKKKGIKLYRIRWKEGIDIDKTLDKIFKNAIKKVD